MKKKILLIVFCAVGFVAVMTTWRFVSAQQNTNESLTKVSKTVGVGNAWNSKISLNVSGLQESDAVNIVPGATGTIVAEVITVADRSLTFPGTNKSITVPLPGEDVADSSLTVSSSSISFSRPTNQNKVLLYVEVPESTMVTIFYGTSKIVDEYPVSSPLKIKDGSLVKGQSALSKAVLVLMNPASETDTEEIKPVDDGVYFVPFEKLTVLNEQNPLAGLAFTANVDINESGQVTKVNVLQPLNSVSVKNAVMSLQFKPFSLKGSNIKVSTVVKQ